MLRLALVVGVLAAESTALAQATVVVLGIRSIEGDDDVANDLTQQLRQTARGVEGWQVSDSAVSMAQMSLAHGCDDLDASCLSDIANSLGAQRIIYGTLRRSSAREDYDYALSLSLFDADSRAIVRSLDVTIPRTEVQAPELDRHAGAMIARLSSVSEGGAIHIQVSAPEADVLINGQPVGRTQDGGLRVQGLQAGQYRVEILKDGYAPHVSVIEVSDGASTGISAVLAERDLTPGLADQDYPETRADRADLEWLGWTLVGVGGASLVGAVVSMFMIKSIDEDEEFIAYRDAVARGNQNPTVRGSDVVTDVCDAARGGMDYPGDFTGDLKDITSMCAQADTFEVLQWVFLGTAVVAGGAGAYILLSDDGDSMARADGPALTLTPRVSGDAAFVSASLRF